MSTFKIYGSSAGSGKTFTLAKTYLSLLLKEEDPRYFKHVLAVTFTNDAAAEMKERILSTLKEISGPESERSGKAETMLQAIREDLGGIEIIELQKRAKAVFDQILEHYADFNVKTIDSFVNQLATSFSRDLGLPYNYEVVLDKDPLLLEATERVFEKIGLPEFDHITKMVQKFAEEEADDGKNWQNILPNLADFAGNLFDDQYFNLIQKNEGLNYKDYQKVSKSISAYLAQTKNTVVNLGNEGLQFIEDNGLSVDHFTSKKSGFPSVFLKAQKAELIEKVASENKSVQAAIVEGKWYTQSQPAGIQAAIDQIAPALIERYQQLTEFIEAERPKYILLKEIKRSLNNLALLGEVYQELGKVLEENNQAFITDFNRRIQQVITNEPVPFIYERLGEKYNHILIDEFQDTSDIQYFNILPLIENSLSKDYFNMVVGDPKQSIYRFRGGKVELMLHLLGKKNEELKANPMLSEHQQQSIDYTNSFLSLENLSKNYRSKEEIIAFNKDFFERITSTDDNSMISEAFANAAQETHAGTQKGGHVEIVVNTEKEVDSEVWYQQEIEGKIEEALADGYALGDIAVLTRRKKNEATVVANNLVKKGYPVISADSLLLSKNVSVVMLISLLKAYNDEAYTNEAFVQYFRYKKEPFPIKLPDQTLWQFLNSKGHEVDLHLMSAFGIYQLAESLASKLGLFEDHASLPYLFALFDLIQTQVKQKGNSLNDFLHYWDQNGKNASVSIKKEDAITVTTIHKSKGLEYPVVIVPYCNWSTNMISTNKVWVNLEDIDWPELETTEGRLLAGQTGSKKDLDVTPIGPQIQNEKDFVKLEALNVLYVAFTRPVDRLYVLSHGTKNNTVGQYLTSYLPEDNSDEVKRTIVYQGSNNQVIKQKDSSESTILVKEINSRENLGNLKIKSSTEKLFNEQNQRDRGNLIHTLFSEIKMAEDLDQALRQLQFSGLIKESEKAELKSDALNLLNDERLKHLFEGNIQVENERDILVKNEDFSRPDRVVYEGEKVTILDYKTGQKRKSHLYQIKKYGELYREMGYEDIEMLLVYLNPTEVIPVRF
ncbi:UvrD-helicase domain-containing protein [Jiulongibacter sp. NS-SX5]|uniref:UvrD-helicase domain-containing protein n=1 Tax=Jiulongibacter sp. NS-SX5 TaxID=3463854 RepID=UPI00405A2A16